MRHHEPLAGVPPALRLANRALSAASDHEREAADRAGVDFIAQHMTQAMQIYERGDDGRLNVTFSGKPDSITFVAPARLGPSGGLFWFRVALADGADRRRSVVLHWSDYRQSLTLQDNVPPQHNRVLFTEVSEFSVAYFGVSQPAQPPSWSDSWDSNQAVPDFVDLRITSLHSNGGMPRRLLIPLRLRERR